MSDAKKLEAETLAAIEAADSLEALEQLRVASLGKKGTVSALLKTLGAMSAEERQTNGPVFNQLRDLITQQLADKKAVLEKAALNARLVDETQDMTLPLADDPLMAGRIHPVSQVMEEVAAIFADLGFDVAEGPDIESQFYNFTALNIPDAHPARQMHDTFYMQAEEEGEPLVLRTHTSPVQVRTMQAGKPPFRFIAPGRTYRCDSDQTHTPMFHQVEGLVVDETTHMGHLKYVLEAFLAAFFEVHDISIRFRPSYFPFTEPSMEIDMPCHRVKNGGDGDRLIVGEGDEWMEIGGSGMVNPHVLTAAGIDADNYQGFAFGMGLDRLAMLKYGAPDLRAFFEADLRWLKHYGFLPIDVPGLAAGLSNPGLSGPVSSGSGGK